VVWVICRWQVELEREPDSIRAMEIRVEMVFVFLD
jgi:hypothetical protein